MTSLPKIILVYLAVTNLAAFVLFGIDKWKARRNLWRVREASLFGIALLGGSLGAWAGMKLFRHKTQHKLFVYGIPIIIVVQIAAAYFLITKL